MRIFLPKEGIGYIIFVLHAENTSSFHHIIAKISDSTAGLHGHKIVEGVSLIYFSFAMENYRSI